MNCEIVAVGTELLLGQIVDTNSSWIGERLAAIGINSHYQTKVGDNWDRISEVLRQAIARSDAVIVTGGLGPTQDDITREVLAELMGVELVLHPAIEQKIRAMFEARGRTMPENNLRQAMVPQGATPIPEQPGTAPGLIAELASPPEKSTVVYLLPGVPREMKAMINGTVLPDLRSRANHADVISSRVLRTWGESESGLAELLSDRIVALDATDPSEGNTASNATLAFLASGIEGIRVRITVRAPSQAAANDLLTAETQTLCDLLGPIVFSLNDESMEQVVLQQLQERGQTLAIAETFTGGLIASRLSAAQSAAQPASQSAAGQTGNQAAGGFAGGIVIPEGTTLAEGTALPNDTALPKALTSAEDLAAYVRQVFDADWGLAICATAIPKAATDTAAVGGSASGTAEVAVAGAANVAAKEAAKGEAKVEPTSSKAVAGEAAADAAKVEPTSSKAAAGGGSASGVSAKSAGPPTAAVPSSAVAPAAAVILPNNHDLRSQWATITALNFFRQTMLTSPNLCLTSPVSGGGVVNLPKRAEY